MNPSDRSAPRDPHARSVAARFSTAAPHYENHDEVQIAAAREVMRRLDDVPAPARLLEIGCGTGRLTSLLLERFPDAEIDAVDISERMIATCRERFAASPRLHWHACDARAFRAARAYDAIAAASSLHWILPHAAFLRRMHDLLAPGGVAALGVMVQGTLRELHETRALVAPLKPPLAALPAPDAFVADLAAAGFAAIDASVEEHRVHYASAGALLRALHSQGLTGGDYSHGARLLGRRELAALSAAYEVRHADPDGGVHATYRVLYARCRVA